MRLEIEFVDNDPITIFADTVYEYVGLNMQSSLLISLSDKQNDIPKLRNHPSIKLNEAEDKAEINIALEANSITYKS